MADLCEPNEYEAFLVVSRTQETLTALPWSSISWQRVKNEVSVGSVGVAAADGGIECCGAIGGLFPWAQMLRIERNGERVWDGPVMGWTQAAGSGDLTVRALDRSAILHKRLVAAHRTYTNVTPYSMMRQLMTDALVTNATYDPYPLSIATATPPAERATREYFTERLETLYSVFQELTKNTMTAFWTTLGDTIYLDALTLATALGTSAAGIAPRMNEQTTIGAPGLDVDGLGMATITYAGGASQGSNGFPLIVANSGALNLFLASRLEKATSEDRSVTDLSLVAGRGAAESAAPQLTLERIQLSPNFGSEFMLENLDNLLPGVQMDLNFEETCAFALPLAEYRESAGTPGLAYTAALTKARLDQIDVDVSKAEGGGITERVMASYRPFITDNLADATGFVPTVDFDAIQLPVWWETAGGSRRGT